MSLDLRTAPRSSLFGAWEQWRKDAGLLWHGADDLPAPLGTPILAPDNGEVVYTGYGFGTGPGTLGYYTIFQTADYGLLMAHQDRAYPEVLGTVQRGDHIGYSGNTGWSTGPHVHLLMSVKRYSNGAFNFSREAGGLVSPDLYWNVGYGTQDIWTRMFNRPVLNTVPVTQVATKRVVTKAELSLIPAETTTIHVAGEWIIYGAGAPDFANARFPDVVYENTALMVRPRAGVGEDGGA